MVILPVVMSQADDYYDDDYNYDDHDHPDNDKDHDNHDDHEHHDEDYHDDHEHHDEDYHDDHDNHDDHDYHEDQDRYDHSHEDYDYDHHKDEGGFNSSPKRFRVPPEGPPHPQPCKDTLPNCASLKSDCRWYGDRCKKTCGLCKPHESNHHDNDYHDDDYHDDDYHDDYSDNSCVDQYNDCDVIAKNNWCSIYPGKCCQSCDKKKNKRKPCKDSMSGCARYKRYKCNKFPDKCKK